MTLIALVLMATQVAAAGGAKPDFSGQWVINESDFGLIPAPQCRGLMSQARVRGDEARRSYTTAANDAKQTARMTWSGNILIIQRSSDDGITMRILHCPPTAADA